MKQMCGICNKNTSKEKYKKLNHLFKMKELNEIALRKGLCLDKRAMLSDKKVLG